VTVFTDGDRAGELILREMLQTMDIDFVARAPRGSEVEELTQKQLLKCLRNKIPINQYLEMTGFESTGATRSPMEERGESAGAASAPRPERREDRDRGRREGGERGGPPPSRLPVPPMAAPPPPPPPPAPLSPELQRYFDLLASLDNSSKSVFLGPDDQPVGEAPVKEMIESLAGNPGPVKTVVFDGVVSQRLLDVAQEKGVETVVAGRMGAVGKIPEGVRIVTRHDLLPAR
jgi:hypothetical protein